MIFIYHQVPVAWICGMACTLYLTTPFSPRVGFWVITWSNVFRAFWVRNTLVCDNSQLDKHDPMVLDQRDLRDWRLYTFGTGSATRDQCVVPIWNQRSFSTMLHQDPAYGTRSGVCRSIATYNFLNLYLYMRSTYSAHLDKAEVSCLAPSICFGMATSCHWAVPWTCKSSCAGLVYRQ